MKLGKRKDDFFDLQKIYSEIITAEKREQHVPWDKICEGVCSHDMMKRFVAGSAEMGIYMKKNLMVLMMAASVFFLTLSGCSTNTGTPGAVHVYEYIGADEASVFEYTGDMFDCEMISEYSDTAPSTRRFTFMGKEYDLIYDESLSKEFIPRIEDQYCDSQQPDLRFSFFENSDELSGIIAFDGIDITSQAQEMSEAGLSELAESILGQYIDISQYEKKCSTTVYKREMQGETAMGIIDEYDYFYTSDNPAERCEYEFKYTKYYKGYKTFEKAYVVLDSFGRLYVMQFDAPGAFDSMTAETLDISDIEAAVLDKAEQVCKAGYSVQGVTTKSTLCVDENGKLFYVVGADFDVEKDSDNSKTIEETIFIVVGK